MKRFFLLCVLLVVTFTASYAEEFPTGFWGVEFGSTKEEAKKIMAEKEGLHLLNEFQGDLTYKGMWGFWSNERIDWLYLDFHNDQMISAMISLKPISDVLFLFDEIVEKINTKYYRTKKLRRHYRYPFSAGDGYGLLAIQEGYAEISARWKFETATISVHVSTDLTVVISYTNTQGRKLQLDQFGEANYKDAEMNDL